MDRATYDQLDRIEQSQEELKDVLYVIAEKLGITDFKESEDLDEDDIQDDFKENKEKLDF